MSPEEKNMGAVPDRDISMPVTVVAIKGTGDGGLTQSTIGVTQDNQPNVYVQVIGRVRALAIRFGHQFVDAFIGAEGLKSMGSYTGWVELPGDAFQLAFFFALTTSIVGLLKNIGTLLTKLEDKYPLWTGNV